MTFRNNEKTYYLRNLIKFPSNYKKVYKEQFSDFINIKTNILIKVISNIKNQNNTSIYLANVNVHIVLQITSRARFIAIPT